MDLEYVRSLTTRYKNFLLKLGFDDSPPNIIRTQYDSLSVLRTLYLSGNYLTDEMFELAKEDIHDYYSKRGKIDEKMTYRIKLSLNLMVADFIDLHIQQGYENVLIFSGIDEYKYVGLAMDVLKKEHSDNNYKFFSLSSFFSITMKGVNGYPKMGKSFPESTISPMIKFDQIEKLIMNEDVDCNIPDDSFVF